MVERDAWSSLPDPGHAAVAAITLMHVKRQGHPDSALSDLIFGWEQHHNPGAGLYPLVLELVDLAARIDAQFRQYEERVDPDGEIFREVFITATKGTRNGD